MARAQPKSLRLRFRRGLPNDRGMIRRLYVEKRPEYAIEAQEILHDLRDCLGIDSIRSLRLLMCYDVEGVEDSVWDRARDTIFSEPPLDLVFEESLPLGPGERAFGMEYLPGQYDQRADSAQQCLRLLADCQPTVRSARVLIFSGVDDDVEFKRIREYMINPVDSREADLEKLKSLQRTVRAPDKVARLEGLISMNEAGLGGLLKELGLAMTLDDLVFCQKYFRDTEKRDPSLTEIKLLDTYWSDHCRHTTFLTEITDVKIADGALNIPVKSAWNSYQDARKFVYGERSDRPVCLMDIALMGMKALRRQGHLANLEESEEVNAASIVVPVDVDGQSEEWLVMFKNETHNHPTEIEPFGGAATCLGGAIRDPLSGRSFVYQAMRVTGAADPRVPVSETLPGKLPQRKITRKAAEGYSSYGNQIGLATGMVHEVYHPGYMAKRMEVGAVIAAAPRNQVMRGEPAPGDTIVLVGGHTGRDGIGGATGSSKEHTETALENSAEVQKGDAPTERKLQRLFRDPDVSRMIKRCNDFGAGGVSVAIGELAPSLDINLDAVPLKYAGLDGTEIALSESQERMAVVLDSKDVDAFIAASAKENIGAVTVASVTDSGRLTMTWQGDRIVDIAREFLDTNGVRMTTTIEVQHPESGGNPLLETAASTDGGDFVENWTATLADLNVCSQKGLVEMFDSTVGSGSVLHPFGGTQRATPAEAMCAKIPLLRGKTTTGTLMSFGFDPEMARWSPFHGALHAVVESVSRVIASGGDLADVRLTLQEYFPRTRNDPARWGLPFAALLGAWEAQRELKTAAIGGKDSMSGTFHELDVPPTLVSFAVSPVELRRVISPEFKQAGHSVYLLEVPLDDQFVPAWDVLRQLYAGVSAAIARGDIKAAAVVRKGGLAGAISKMSFGNQVGFSAVAELADDLWFSRRPGSFVIEWAGESTPDLPGAQLLGATQDSKWIQVGGHKLALEELQKAWEAPLEEVFPTRVPTESPTIPHQLFEPHVRPQATTRTAKPRVLIPVFPGTNCEYDSQRAFEEQGAEVELQVFRNRNYHEVEDSIHALAASLDNSNILMIPGGFSAGDEPDGSGKFIATVFRHPRLADSVMKLLQQRDGLVLGICNGFQALIKLGLLPHGEIRPQTPEDPTLARNHLGRHISCYARTKVVSKRSPWLSLCEMGGEYLVAMSHGEGRLVGPPKVLSKLFENDQVATQYVNAQGLPTQSLPENPNGSYLGIEGLVSPCGRIFGKMGHSERAGRFIGVNVPGPKYQPIIASGVAYFKD